MVRDRVEVESVAEHVWVVALHGEHDLSTSKQVGRAIDEVFAGGSRIVLDLSQATFIDSTVLAAVVEAQERADKKPDDELVVVAVPGSAPRRALDLAQIELRVDIYDSRDEALAAVHG